MKNILKIIVKYPRVGLILEKNGKLIEEIFWEDKNDISNQLLTQINELLGKNNLTVQDLAQVSTVSNQKSYTASRIARTITKTINFCLKQK